MFRAPDRVLIFPPPPHTACCWWCARLESTTICTVHLIFSKSASFANLAHKQQHKTTGWETSINGNNHTDNDHHTTTTTTTTTTTAPSYLATPTLQNDRPVSNNTTPFAIQFHKWLANLRSFPFALPKAPVAHRCQKDHHVINTKASTPNTEWKKTNIEK